MSFLTALFQRPKIPNIALPPPPSPVRNPQIEAEMAQAGRQQGLLATLFGYRTPSGGSTAPSRSLTTGRSNPSGGRS